MPTVEYPTNPNTDTVFVIDDNNKRTRSLKTVLVDGTIDYPKSANVKDCYVTIDGKKQRALMTADVSKDGVVEYPDGNNSTKGYITVDGKKHRVVLTATLAGGEPAIDELNVTPSTSAQTITAPEGTDGYSPVNVSAVTSSIDANIQAGNIKKDVTILGVTGSYEAPTPTGTINITTNGTHDVSSYANADVQVPTTAPDYYLEKGKSGTKLVSGPTMLNLSGITDIGNYALSFAYYFNTSISGNIDLSALTSISGAQACSNMFNGCSGITGANLSNVVQISGQNACSSMFNNCGFLTTLDLSSLETMSGQAACQSMCSYATRLANLDLSSLKIVSGNNSFQNAFYGCDALKSIDLSNLEEITGSYSCAQMFFDADIQNNVVFSKLNKVTGSYCCQRMFSSCPHLTSISFPALNSTSFGNQTNQFNFMLNGCSGVTVHFPSNLQSVIGSWSDVTSGFGGTNTTILFDLPATE